MSTKVSITLDDEVLQFIDRQSPNRSRFINDLLRQAQRQQLLLELASAYTEQVSDLELQTELALWDTVSGDGLAQNA